MKDTELLRENEKYLVDEYTSGVSLNQLSKEFGVNSGTLWYVLDEFGVAGDGGDSWSERAEIDEEHMMQRYDDGESISSIAKDLDLATDTISDRLKENGVEIRTISKQTSLSRTTEYDFSEYQLDIIRGELLGGGSLVKGDGCTEIKTYCFNLNVTSREHVKFVMDELHDELFPENQPYLKEPQEEHHQDQWVIRSGICRTLTEIEQKWYNGRNKLVPKDLELNETVLKHWYWGDGNLAHGPHAKITTVGFDEESVNHLSNELERIEYTNYINEDKRDYNGSGKYPRLSVESTKKMINSIETEVSDYDYKFDKERVK